jgi:hypothetical protein
MLPFTDGRECRHLHDEKFCRQFVLTSLAQLSPLWLMPSLLATAEELDRILGVNVRGTFLCFKYAAKHMIEQGRGGRIIGKPPIPFSVFASLILASHVFVQVHVPARASRHKHP